MTKEQMSRKIEEAGDYCRMCGQPFAWSVFFEVPLYNPRTRLCNICDSKVFSWTLNLRCALEAAVWAARPDMLYERAKAVMKGEY